MHSDGNDDSSETVAYLKEACGRRLLRLRQVREATGMSKAWIYKAMSTGTFPRPLRVSTRAVAWREVDIIQWQGGLKSSARG